MTPPAAAAAPAVRRARSAAPARPLTTAPRPRRVSGPARPQRPRTQTRRPASAETGLAVGALAALRGVEGHPLLDRLIGGRTWIGLVAFALIGIVTLQLGLLKLNAGIGRTLEQMASLQRGNATLSIENSELAAGDRVESSAARLGMELVPIGALRSLTPRPGLDARRAANALSTPAHVTPITSTPIPTTAAGAESASAEATSSEATTSSTSSSTPEQTAPASSTQTSAEAPAPATGESSSHESQPPASEIGSAGGAQAGPTG